MARSLTKYLVNVMYGILDRNFRFIFLMFSISFIEVGNLSYTAPGTNFWDRKMCQSFYVVFPFSLVHMYMKMANWKSFICIFRRADIHKGSYYFKFGRFGLNWQHCLACNPQKMQIKDFHLAIFIDIWTKLNEKAKYFSCYFFLPQNSLRGAVEGSI